MKQIVTLIRTAILVAVLTSVAAPVYALSLLPHIPHPQATPTNAPIDGGASLLLASGALYAARHLRKRKSQC